MATHFEFYEKVEDSIITRLAPLADMGIDIESVPENPGASNRPFQKGLITVGYSKSNFGDSHGAQGGSVSGPFSISDASQEEELVIEVNVQGRTRRSNAQNAIGSLRMLRIVRAFLLGWKPHHCEQLFLKEQGFVNFDNKAWEFAMVFNCRTYAIPDGDTDDLGALLKTIQFDETIEQ